SLWWLSYRQDFPRLADRYHTDVGWGCMLRSAQMMLASALRIQRLGRAWRRAPSIDAEPPAYREILEGFLDTHAAPYSLHRIALIGTDYGKAVGEWFGPLTAAQVIQRL
ncbi:hypothetical protein CXG81DRAFT_4866, partial [Caulochytrium protostelioides]